MDQLKERDREIVLLRFFQGMTFAEIGATLHLSENNARMRATRALEKLRHHLARRGIQSTAGVAALLETASTFGAPPTLAAAITQAALAAAPSSTVAAFFSGLLVGKVAACLLGATLGIAITASAWSTLARGVDTAELRALRSENVRLRQAGLDGNLDAVAQQIAGEYVARATTVLQEKAVHVARRKSVGSDRYHDRGQATPLDAFLSYAWAIDAGDTDALARILTYDPKSLVAIQTLYDRMPAEIRAEYPTTEKLVAFLYVADAILNPVPGPDVTEKFAVTETGPGRASVREPSAKRDGLQIIQTDAGWKCVVPSGYPEHVARRILGSGLFSRLGSN